MRMHLDESVNGLVEVFSAGLARDVFTVCLHRDAAARAEPPAAQAESAGTASPGASDKHLGEPVALPPATKRPRHGLQVVRPAPSPAATVQLLASKGISARIC